jgi:hypothetical protein
MLAQALQSLFKLRITGFSAHGRLPFCEDSE